jgi:hypothetical protein
MRMCLKCDESIVGPWAFRIRIGGVTHDEFHGTLFVQDPADHFLDYTKTKWLCRRCAEESGLWIGHLKLDACRVPDGLITCKQPFQPVEEPNCESVLLVEWGQFCTGDKGPGEMFLAANSAHVHFNCACDGWGLPLWSISPGDTPC